MNDQQNECIPTLLGQPSCDASESPKSDLENNIGPSNV